MRYLLSVLIPPLGVLLTGRLFAAAFMLAAWVFICLFVWPVHVVFVIVAWIIIAQAKADRRQKRLLDAMKRS